MVSRCCILGCHPSLEHSQIENIYVIGHNDLDIKLEFNVLIFRPFCRLLLKFYLNQYQPIDFVIPFLTGKILNVKLHFLRSVYKLWIARPLTSIARKFGESLCMASSILSKVWCCSHYYFWLVGTHHLIMNIEFVQTVHL